MKKILCLLLLLYLFSCNNNSSNKTSSSKNQADSTLFFPVNDYLRSELEEINKTPFLIYKKTEENKSVTDSSVITKDQLLQLAQQFLNDSITNPSLKHQYSFTLFHDLSTQSFAFTYSALQDDLKVRAVNVLLNDENNTLKSVFISAINTADSVKDEKLIWRAGKSFKISRIILRNEKEIEQTIFVSWNDK